MTSRPSVLLVSKPVAPPWNDSAKNLARDLANSLTRCEVTVLTHRDGAVAKEGDGLAAHVKREIAFERTSAFAPKATDNIGVARVLLTSRMRINLWHFLFAPNPRTSAVARSLAMLARQRTVQTVASAPRGDVRLRDVLFGDRVVVLSRHTELRFAEAGFDRTRLVRIPPAVGALHLRSETQAQARARFDLPTGAAVMLYPGDLEIGGGAERCVRALAAIDPGVLLVCACRPKTSAAAAARERLMALSKTLGVERRVRWFGDITDIHDLIFAANVVALPSDDLYAKMDIPLVLVEAALLGKPTVVLRNTPAEELVDLGLARSAETSEGSVGVEVLAALKSADDESASARFQDIARTAFDPLRMAASYEAVYASVLHE